MKAKNTTLRVDECFGARSVSETSSNEEETIIEA